MNKKYLISIVIFSILILITFVVSIIRHQILSAEKSRCISEAAEFAIILKLEIQKMIKNDNKIPRDISEFSDDIKENNWYIKNKDKTDFTFVCLDGQLSIKMKCCEMFIIIKPFEQLSFEPEGRLD